MAGRLSDSDESISDINVVPLVDIILVVLIIFMVTAPMIMKPSINVNLPKAASGDKSANKQFQITITADSRILLNGHAVDASALKVAAEVEIKKNPETQAVIQADKSVPHGQVVTVMDAVKQGGIKKFAISVDKENP
jgi:biopolymer transport protein ExbD